MGSKLAPLVMGLLAAAAAPAGAGEWSVGAGAGTLGLGAEVGYALNDRLALRLGGYGFSLNRDGEESGIRYDGDVKLANVGLLLDWHPFAGAFRLSGGWFATDNRLQGVGRPREGGSYDIGGTTFTADQVGELSAKADFGSSAPFLGAGWLWGRADGGLAWSLDLGVLFQGSPDVSLRSTGGSLSGQPQLQSALAAEEAELENDLDSYDFYPVISLGVSYRF